MENFWECQYFCRLQRSQLYFFLHSPHISKYRVIKYTLTTFKKGFLVEMQISVYENLDNKLQWNYVKMMFNKVIALIIEECWFFFFRWRPIIDNLMTHDKTTFRDLMGKCIDQIDDQVEDHSRMLAVKTGEDLDF